MGRRTHLDRLKWYFMLEKNLEKTIGIYYFLILRKYFFLNEGDLYKNE